MTKDRMFGVLCHGVCCAFMVLALVMVPKAQVIDHSSGFDPHTDLTANGDASFPVVMGTTIARLTPDQGGKRGSIFSNQPVCVNSFETWFTFKIGPFGTMADGMTFTIQSNGPTALGSAGGGLGYGQDHIEIPAPTGLVIPHSVAVKIDIWNNIGETENSTGVFTNGRSPTISTKGWVICNAQGCNARAIPDTLVVVDKRPVAQGGTGIDFRSVHEFLVELSYDGTTLTETVTDTVTDASITVDYKIDIPSIIGTKDNRAYVGFTGATGGVTATHDVLTWRYQCPAPAM